MLLGGTEKKMEEGVIDSEFKVKGWTFVCLRKVRCLEFRV